MGFTRYYSRDHNRRCGTSVLMQQYNSGRDRSYVNICFDPGSAEETGWKNVTRIRCRTCRLAFTAYYYRKSTCTGILISSSSIQTLSFSLSLERYCWPIKVKSNSVSVIDYPFNRVSDRRRFLIPNSSSNARNTIQRIHESLRLPCNESIIWSVDQVVL